MDTTYSYNVLNQLTQVTMTRGGAAQTRTFNYDVNTGRLMSATNPENGTVSYTYNPNGTLATRTDAKNQQVVYSYDSYNRVTQIQRNLPPQYQGGPYLEDVCQRATYYYDLNPFDAYFSAHGWGRLVAVRWGWRELCGAVSIHPDARVHAGRAAGLEAAASEWSESGCHVWVQQ